MSRKIIIATVVLGLILTTGVGVVGCGKSLQENIEAVAGVSSISVSPEEITLAPNGTQQFQATLYDSSNNVITDESASISWSVSGDVGTITQNGTFTATAIGDGQVIASMNTTQDIANISVIDGTPPSDFSLTISSNEVIVSTETYTISWTASEAKHNGLKEYQVLGRKESWTTGSFGVLENHIDASITSITVNLMVDGVWELKVRAVDNKGLWRDSDGTSAAGDVGNSSRNLVVTFDSVPPWVFSISNIYDGQYFDSRNVTIEWNPSHDVNLDYYELYIGTDQNNINGSSVYSKTFPSDVTSCEVNFPGGIYYIYIAAYDKATHYRTLKGKTDMPEYDNIILDSWPMFEIDHEPPTIAYNPLAYPPVTNNPFSPNGDGIEDSTTINYNIGDDSYWRVNYLHQDEVRIETKIEIVAGGWVERSWQESLPPGWHSKEWDGKNNHESVVIDGNYTVRITAIDKAMNVSTDESQSITVDK